MPTTFDTQLSPQQLLQHLAIAFGDPGLAPQDVAGKTLFKYQSELVALLTAIKDIDRSLVTLATNLDITTTSQIVVGTAQNAANFTDFLLYLYAQAFGTATNRTLQFQVQFSPDGGASWADYSAGFFPNLLFEDGETASQQRKAFDGRITGKDWRLVAQAAGTVDATNKFTISAFAEFLRR